MMFYSLPSFPAPAVSAPSADSLTWDELVAMFETMSAAPAISSSLTVVSNTTLEQDRETLLRLWKAMGRDEDKLRRGCCGDNEDLNDVSKWIGMQVEGGRVTRLHWGDQGLSGTVPAEIGALSALTHLALDGNCLRGELPPELGNLTSLTDLGLRYNLFTGPVPSFLAKLTNLETIGLNNNKFTTDIPPSTIHKEKDGVKDYLYKTFRRPTIRYVITCIIVTNRRPPSYAIHPYFTFLANNEDITLIVLTFLGREEVQTYNAAKKIFAPQGLSLTLYLRKTSNSSLRLRLWILQRNPPPDFLSIVLLTHEEQASYTAINPAEKVPFLFINGTTGLSETACILKYLDSILPSPPSTPPLFPSDPLESALAQAFVQSHDIYVSSPNTTNPSPTPYGLNVHNQSCLYIPPPASGRKRCLDVLSRHYR